MPSVLPDLPSRGKRSDHNVPVMYPLDNTTIKNRTEYRERTTRPLPDPGIRMFGLAMVEEDWEEVREEDSPMQQDEAWQVLLGKMLDN